LNRKNPIVAFFVGALFGAPGIGLYFWSWGDFFLCSGVYLFFIIGSIPTIVGMPIAVLLGGLFSGIYGVWRASK